MPQNEKNSERNLLLLRKAKKKFCFSQLQWQEGENLRSEAGALEPSGVWLFAFAPARPPQQFWVPWGPSDASQSRKTRFS